jgi:hypothetical protein
MHYALIFPVQYSKWLRFAVKNHVLGPSSLTWHKVAFVSHHPSLLLTPINLVMHFDFDYDFLIFLFICCCRVPGSVMLPIIGLSAFAEVNVNEIIPVVEIYVLDCSRVTAESTNNEPRSKHFVLVAADYISWILRRCFTTDEQATAASWISLRSASRSSLTFSRNSRIPAHSLRETSQELSLASRFW